MPECDGNMCTFATADNKAHWGVLPVYSHEGAPFGLLAGQRLWPYCFDSIQVTALTAQGGTGVPPSRGHIGTTAVTAAPCGELRISSLWQNSGAVPQCMRVESGRQEGGEGGTGEGVLIIRVKLPGPFAVQVITLAREGPQGSIMHSRKKQNTTTPRVPRSSLSPVLMWPNPG